MRIKVKHLNTVVEIEETYSHEYKQATLHDKHDVERVIQIIEQSVQAIVDMRNGGK